MDVKQKTDRILGFLKKYRYAVLVLLFGIVLMNIPTKGNKRTTPKPEKNTSTTVKTAEERLSLILSKIDGVGSVEVMLTEACGQENVYQTDEDITESNGNSSEKNQTVIIKDSDRNEVALVQKTIPPKYLGAIIVCQGADNPSVRLALVDAVCKITGLGSDRVSIVKMK